MNIENLRPPAKGFTKAEREWIKNVLIPALKTVHGIAGRNTTVDNSEAGQTINTAECSPCP